MKISCKFLSILTLASLMLLTFATPAAAFDGREGDTVVISADEVIEEDLYVGANQFVLEGTVKGDLIVGGTSIVINGTVEGDLWAAGQSVVINGTVMDDARIAGAGLQLGENAQVDGDLLAAGASLETSDGSQVGNDLLVGSAQALLAGDVDGDVLAGTSALELRGEFGGDVKAYVDQTSEAGGGPPPSTYIMNAGISIPTVQPGLTVASSASIDGDLEYTSTVELNIPASSVGGDITRTEPEFETTAAPREPTVAEKTGNWLLDWFRSVVTLILFGLLLGWLFPNFLRKTSGKVQNQALASLGWGAIAYGVFFFALLLVVIVMVAGGIIFGALTLDGISNTVIWLGILALFGLIIGFVLVTTFLTKIVVGAALGRWIFSKASPSVAENPYLPMVVGVVIITVVVALLRFPLLPLGFFGWLLNFAVILFGLGALWLATRDRTKTTVQPVG